MFRRRDLPAANVLMENACGTRFVFDSRKISLQFVQEEFYTEPLCEDKDECALGNHNCAADMHCVNKPGSFFVSFKFKL